MTESEILEGLTSVLKDVLDHDDVHLTMDTTAADVEGWDSLAQIRIMLGVEQKFAVHFNTAEISTLPNVGALVALISRKVAG